MPQRRELAATVQTVEEFATPRPELGTYRVGLRRYRVVRLSEISALGHTSRSGRRDKYLSPAAAGDPIFRRGYRRKPAAEYAIPMTKAVTRTPVMTTTTGESCSSFSTMNWSMPTPRTAGGKSVASADGVVFR